MTNGHTPGPWSIDKEERWIIHEPDGKSGTLVVPEIYLDDDEAIANARLIAAAPDLYQHAEALLADVMKRYGITADGLTCPHMRGLAEAIDKARGTA
ncbi:hypothetical protein [Stutzerimonas nitrititolerans]|uniref:hypothetical protein n=1 Tax=Stutzerimonas nitrititolerans TaxID=2482751 RepID=UPI00289D91F4|nr:hypothetical protein [Stutzerimonas nitrititolerans]